MHCRCRHNRKVVQLDVGSLWASCAMHAQSNRPINMSHSMTIPLNRESILSIANLTQHFSQYSRHFPLSALAWQGNASLCHFVFANGHCRFIGKQFRLKYRFFCLPPHKQGFYDECISKLAKRAQCGARRMMKWIMCVYSVRRAPVHAMLDLPFGSKAAVDATSTHVLDRMNTVCKQPPPFS